MHAATPSSHIPGIPHQLATVERGMFTIQTGTYVVPYDSDSDTESEYSEDWDENNPLQCSFPPIELAAAVADQVGSGQERRGSTISNEELERASSEAPSEYPIGRDEVTAAYQPRAGEVIPSAAGTSHRPEPDPDFVTHTASIASRKRKADQLESDESADPASNYQPAIVATAQSGPVSQSTINIQAPTDANPGPAFVDQVPSIANPGLSIANPGPSIANPTPAPAAQVSALPNPTPTTRPIRPIFRRIKAVKDVAVAVAQGMNNFTGGVVVGSGALFVGLALSAPSY